MEQEIKIGAVICEQRQEHGSPEGATFENGV
jgi:hypothetical protein